MTTGAMTVVALAALLLGRPGPSRGDAKAAPCEPSRADLLFFQESLDAWQIITRDLLRIPRPELPWMLMFDRACAYHVGADADATSTGPRLRAAQAALRFAGRAAPVLVAPLADTVALPDGASIPVRGMAFTSVYGEGAAARPFFVTALPDVWRHDPTYADDPEDWPPFVLSVLAHELVHTLQIVAIRERLERLQARFPSLPAELDDDLLQKRYAGVPGVDPTVRAEIALLYAAQAEPDGARARELAGRALALLRARRATYYGADAEALGTLEDTFLNMEGVACWSALQMERRRRPAASPAAALDAFRGEKKWWSQEEGLALFLLLDRFVADWPRRVLAPELRSPVALLEAALAPPEPAR